MLEMRQPELGDSWGRPRCCPSSSPVDQANRSVKQTAQPELRDFSIFRTGQSGLPVAENHAVQAVVGRGPMMTEWGSCAAVVYRRAGRYPTGPQVANQVANLPRRAAEPQPKGIVIEFCRPLRGLSRFWPFPTAYAVGYVPIASFGGFGDCLFVQVRAPAVDARESLQRTKKLRCSSTSAAIGSCSPIRLSTPAWRSMTSMKPTCCVSLTLSRGASRRSRGRTRGYRIRLEDSPS